MEQTPSINHKTAIQLAKASQWVYTFSPGTKGKFLKVDGKMPLRAEKIEDDSRVPTSFAGVIEYPDYIVIAFQGTITDKGKSTDFGRFGTYRLDSLIDWIQNFRLTQLTTGETSLPGLVHEGFYRQFKLIAEKIVETLPVGGTKPILLTGHSQGGAVAVLAAKWLKDRGFPIQEVYTFAAPRAGDANFKRGIRFPVYRVEFGDDIVPHVPPTFANGSLIAKGLGTLSGFFQLPAVLVALQNLIEQHEKSTFVSVGRLTYRREDGSLLADMERSEESKLFNQRKLSLPWAKNGWVEHHDLNHYISMFGQDDV